MSVSRKQSSSLSSIRPVDVTTLRTTPSSGMAANPLTTADSVNGGVLRISFAWRSAYGGTANRCLSVSRPVGPSSIVRRVFPKPIPSRTRDAGRMVTIRPIRGTCSTPCCYRVRPEKRTTGPLLLHRKTPYTLLRGGRRIMNRVSHPAVDPGDRSSSAVLPDLATAA